MVAQGIDHKPDYNLWVGHILRKRDSIISAVKQRNARYLKRMHKFGIEETNMVAEAISLYENNGDTLWLESIAKEMKNVRAALKIIAEGGKPSSGYHKIRCHMIFDIKMEDFRCGSRLVSGVHVTEPPATIMYAIVVSIETFRVALTVAALNYLQVRTADIQNSCIQAPVA